MVMDGRKRRHHVDAGHHSAEHSARDAQGDHAANVSHVA
jgi:hypothetical protein